MNNFVSVKDLLDSILGDHSSVRNFVAMIGESLAVTLTTWAAILIQHEYVIEHALMVVGGLTLIGIRIYAALDDAKYRRERVRRQHQNPGVIDDDDQWGRPK